jgi:DNA-binding transcriptional LysR family regulator
MTSLAERLGDLRLGDLATLLAVRRGGSISAAARELGVTPSQVSKAIGRLEATLRLQLLSRGARSVGLSEAGLQVLPHVEAAMARLLVVGRANDEATPVLSVAAPSYLLAAFLPGIEGSLPGLRVQAIELPPALLRAYSSEDFFDLCLCAGGADGLPVTWSSVCAGQLRRALFASPELANRLGPEPVSVDRIRTVPFVCPVYYADGHLVPASDDSPLQRADRAVGHQVLSFGLALDLAAHSGQLVFGPAIAAQRHVEAGLLREVRVQGWNVVSPLYVACNGDRVLARVQATVVEAVRGRLSDLEQVDLEQGDEESGREYRHSGESRAAQRPALR